MKHSIFYFEGIPKEEIGYKQQTPWCRNVIGTLGAIIGAITAGTSVASSVVGSKASSKAASTQSASADAAAKLQKQAADAALKEQKRQFDIGQANLQPWLNAGNVGLQSLMTGLGLSMPQTQSTGTTGQPGVSPITANETLQSLQQKAAAYQHALNTDQNLDPNMTEVYQKKLADTMAQINAMGNMATPSGQAQDIIRMNPSSNTTATTPDQRGTGTAGPVSFGELMKTFTNEDFTKDPGYDFRMQEGADLVSQSAAAKGMPFGGAAAKALTKYGQDYASNEYQNAYNRFNADQTNRYNRLASLAGVGQTTANTLNTTGQNYANNVSNIGMSSAANQGDYLTQAANARASGYMGSANAWASGLTGAGNSVMNAYLMNKIFK